MHHPVTVLFPMVTTIDELRAARALLAEAAAEVGCPSGAAGVRSRRDGRGTRLRPSARAAVPLVDLISIGTNDLTQYTLAAERGNDAVAALADPLDPAVLQLITEVTHAADRTPRGGLRRARRRPRAAALLVGLGVRELSMSPPAIPAVKDAVRSLSAKKAQHLARLALQRDSAASVHALLRDQAGWRVR